MPERPHHESHPTRRPGAQTRGRPSVLRLRTSPHAGQRSRGPFIAIRSVGHLTVILLQWREGPPGGSVGMLGGSMGHRKKTGRAPPRHAYAARVSGRKRGDKEKPEQFNVKMPPALVAALDAIVEEHNRLRPGVTYTRSELIREALYAYVEAHAKKR